ncbi:MAG: DUF4230 domain-containing protein [Clostridia bacterium]|jgi:hypothetical protein|nr:DUF4230 domain-containing protein [Clostridia bacterium]NLS86103.1 DUF4230 domain-containing protein [Oscillospiraceae bacterium]
MNTTKQKHKMPRVLKCVIIKVCIAVAILLALFVAFLALRAKIENAFNVEINLPKFIENMLPDALMGYNKIELINAVTGEAREKRELVVLEQDVNADTQISSALANIAIFKKTRTIHSSGTGVFTVDLSSLDSEAVTVDVSNRLVTVKIPKPALSYVTIDSSKTAFEDTERAFLAFGDITMTQEQQKELEIEIDAAMRTALAADDVQQKAEAAAKRQLKALFETTLSPLTQGFEVEIVV